MKKNYLSGLAALWALTACQTATKPTVEEKKPNITKFGAFVDVGVKQDGLVHISQLADRFISDPNEIVKLHQHVQVKVTEVDLPRKRIQLSLKDVPQD